MLRTAACIVGAVMLLLGLVQPAQAQAGAQLRLIVALDDVPSVDVYWNGRLKTRNFDYGSISVHLSVPAGRSQVSVAPVGLGSGAAFDTHDVDIEAGKQYTLAIVGRRDATQFQLFEDTLTPPAPGSVRLRLVHVAPAHGPIAVHIARGATLVDALPFGRTSAYLELPGGRYQLQFTPAGSRDLLATQRDRRLLAGTIYDLVMLDQGRGVLVEMDTYTPVRLLPTAGVLAPPAWLLGCAALVLLVAGAVIGRGRAAAS